MKFTVSGTNTEFLESKTIEADSKEQAIEKYQELWENGEILVVDSEVKVN